jgi:hypothetical protein
MARNGYVSNALLREACLYSNLTSPQIAQRIGWYRDGTNMGDGLRVMRALGLVKYQPGRGHEPKYREELSVAVAQSIADAINVDYRDVGL